MNNEQKIQESPEVKAKKRAMAFVLMEAGIEFAVMIAAPLIAFIYAGRWLEARYHSKLFMVAGILLALALSSYMIYRKILDLKNLVK